MTYLHLTLSCLGAAKSLGDATRLPRAAKICGCAHRALLVRTRRRVVLLGRLQAVARLGGIR